MLNTIDAISQLLQGSFLDGQSIRQREIPESNQWAFLMDVDQVNALNAWYLLRSLLKETRRYPVLSEGWESDVLPLSFLEFACAAMLDRS
ncbi:MAG: hypothetical protein ACP5RH_02345 [Leptodesmis sp.]|uniref:hypothetical protein n=1 Tax=Leptodesmis sp. TaxID=3100501 RepID=UPI003D0BFB73